MEDRKIIDLYFLRDEHAIQATAEKYGEYCNTIAWNILENSEDVLECVNDTYWNAWNSIPPNRPRLLSAFLGKITRNLAFNRYKYAHVKKRGGGEVMIATRLPVATFDPLYMSPSSFCTKSPSSIRL